MLLLAIILKGLIELLLLTHVAQAILFVFAGATRDRNIVYRIFATVNRPIWRLTRWITPRFIVDAHVGFVSFFLLSVLWAAAFFGKVYFYLESLKAGG